MSLFFDREWFEARLTALGMSRDTLAAAAGLSPDEIEAIYKDQREVSRAEVAAFARLLDETPAEIANRCGISTPLPLSGQPASLPLRHGPGPGSGIAEDELRALHARIDRVERLLLEILDRLGPPLP